MDKRKMAEIMQQKAEGPLRDIYPVIANDILKRFGSKTGTCLDIGGGTGQLCLAMAEISDFQLLNLDVSEEMLTIAQKNFQAAGMEQRINNVLGNVENMPLESESVDLIMSRGSSFAWDNHEKAFSEIFRVLKKGGKAYISIGCIFGTDELRHSIIAEFKKEEPNWEAGSIERESKFTFDNADKICTSIGIQKYTKLNNGLDKWLVISR